MVGRRVGFDLQRIVEPLVGVHRAHRDHPVCYLAYLSEVLMTHMSSLLAVLTIAGFVYDESSGFIRGRSRLFEHQPYPEAAHLLGIPARLGEEPLQALGLLALRSYDRFGVGQSRQSLVALLGQQQVFEVTPESLTLGAVGEKVVETGGVIFQRNGSGLYGLPVGHGGPTSYREHHSTTVPILLQQTTGTRIIHEGS